MCAVYRPFKFSCHLKIDKTSVVRRGWPDFNSIRQNNMPISAIWFYCFCLSWTRLSCCGGAVLLPVSDWVTLFSTRLAHAARLGFFYKNALYKFTVIIMIMIIIFLIFLWLLLLLYFLFFLYFCFYNNYYYYIINIIIIQYLKTATFTNVIIILIKVCLQTFLWFSIYYIYGLYNTVICNVYSIYIKLVKFIFYFCCMISYLFYHYCYHY